MLGMHGESECEAGQECEKAVHQRCAETGHRDIIARSRALLVACGDEPGRWWMVDGRSWCFQQETIETWSAYQGDVIILET